MLRGYKQAVAPEKLVTTGTGTGTVPRRANEMIVTGDWLKDPVMMGTTAHGTGSESESESD